jgi:hypothetical protein
LGIYQRKQLRFLCAIYILKSCWNSNQRNSHGKVVTLKTCLGRVLTKISSRCTEAWRRLYYKTFSLSVTQLLMSEQGELEKRWDQHVLFFHFHT